MESHNDSADLASDFHNLYRIENSPSYGLYENWNTDDPHYKAADSLIEKTNYFLNLDSTKIVMKDSLHDFTVPVKENRITSEFGRRYYRFHYGTDIDLLTGDSVTSAMDGQVRYTGYYHGYGKTVVVRHYNGLETVYAHLSYISVTTNEYVRAGDLLGLGGSSGRSTGSHLHFETRYLGAAFDSEAIVNYDKFQLKDDTLWLNSSQFSYIEPVRERKNAKYHVIQKGDTLSKIARIYRTSVSKLCRINGISRDRTLRIGRKLRLP